MMQVLALVFTATAAAMSQASPPEGGSGFVDRQAQPLTIFVTTIAPSGERVQHVASSWDGASDEDTLLVVLQPDTVVPDSIRLYARTGPLAMLDDVPNATLADSLGTWVRATDSLFRRSERATRSKLGLVIGTILPREAIAWARTSRPRRPYLTRIAVVIWEKGRAVRAELEIFHGV